MTIVITHPEMGVYLGNCMGLGFWSNMDSVGQPSACTFEDEAQAHAHVASWDEQNHPASYQYRPVTAAHSCYATISELKAAGLGTMLGDMESDALRYAEPAGNA